MDKYVLNDFLSGFDDKRYPGAFLQKYELMECLANNPMGETLLVKDRFNAFYIAKCYTDSSVLSKTTENVLLKSLHHDGLPAFVEEFQNDTMLCVVREYAQGIPLSRLEKPLDEQQIISVCTQLCDILTYLHGQTPPVIHRDLKPQNIILGETGRVMLIDFGISRMYDENARADTVFFGTQEFAPPEQYGFSQTDSRADIFSLGVVLAWLLSGKTRIDRFRAKNRRLERIVRKCTAFAPRDRCRDARRVKRALLGADGHRQKKALAACCAALALFAALTAGFAIGRFTDVRPALFYDNSYAVFSEPLVEHAVRLQLGKTEGEPVRVEELEMVTELYLYADQTVKTQNEFYTMRQMVDRGEIAVSGEAIAALGDITKLKNLKRLSLGYQEVDDISALSELTGLESLEIYGCPIGNIEVIRGLTKLKHFTLQQCEAVTDISPLAACPGIRELIITECKADDFSALAALGDIEYLHMIGMEPEKFLPYLQGKKVRQLKIVYASLSSISQLAGIEGLEDLTIDDVQLQSLEGIEGLTSLKHISLRGAARLDLAPLAELPFLETVTLSEDMRGAAAAIEAENFEIIYA
jgi:Serine/threonine protein kinase